jgi:hypothetical protein
VKFAQESDNLFLELLFIVFDCCSEDKLEKVVDDKGPLEFEGLAKHEEVQGLSAGLAKLAHIASSALLLVLEESV